jgi:hypothetical protein
MHGAQDTPKAYRRNKWAEAFRPADYAGAHEAASDAETIGAPKVRSFRDGSGAVLGMFFEACGRPVSGG